MRLQGAMSAERMCQLAGVSRAGFYRYLQGWEGEEEVVLRSAIQNVVLEHRWVSTTPRYVRFHSCRIPSGANRYFWP
jgi:hypothetical protein